MSVLGVAVALTALTVGFAPAATAAAPGVLTGTVTGSDGRPLAGVEVALVHRNGPGGGGQSIDRSTRTNAAGRYAFTGDLAGTGDNLQFSGAGATGGTSATGYGDVCFKGSAPLCWLSSGAAVVDVPDGGRRTIDAALPRAGVLKGRAVDSAGRGVGGLPVTVWGTRPDFFPDSSTLPTANRTTDSNGNYRLPVSAYGWWVCFGRPGEVHTGTPATKFGYAGICLDRTVVEPGGTSSAGTTVPRGSGLAGTVVSKNTADPVPGASVSVYTQYTSVINPPIGHGVRSDGTFKVFGLPAGPATWCVDAPGFTEKCSKVDVDLAPGKVTSIGTIKLVQSS
ncbi:carboxypeptidase-like regulatory domain-containing protein [Jatrophihabitans sp. YIM 134969]